MKSEELLHLIEQDRSCRSLGIDMIRQFLSESPAVDIHSGHHTAAGIVANLRVRNWSLSRAGTTMHGITALLDSLSELPFDEEVRMYLFDDVESLFGLYISETGEIVGGYAVANRQGYEPK